MGKVIISSDACYEGYNQSEDNWVIDTYSNLEKDKTIDESTIQYAQYFWEEIHDEFLGYISSEITHKEKETNSTVEAIGLIGGVGRWTGRHKGGKIYNVTELNNIMQMDVDDIEVIAEEPDNTITIYGHHHDGTHSMNIYLITEKDMKASKVLNDYDMDGIDGLNELNNICKLADHMEPLKLRAENGYY